MVEHDFEPNFTFAMGAIVAIITVGLATLCSELLRPYVEPNPFVFFFAAVAISAWYGGLGSGFLATSLAVIAVSVSFMGAFNPGVIRDDDNIRIAVFILVAVLISALSEIRRRGEERIRAQREEIAVTLASISDAVIAANASGSITYMNATAEQITGWLSADAIGEDIATVFRIRSPDTRQPIAEPISKALREGRKITTEPVLLIDHNGKEQSIETNGAPIRDKTKHIVGAVLVFRDITRRLQAMERAQRIQEITGVLATALTERQVANVMIKQGIAALGADAGVLAIVKPDGDALEILEVSGYPDDVFMRGQIVAIDSPTPLSDTVRIRTPILIESRQEALVRYPQLAEVYTRMDLHTWANLPLILNNQVIGVLKLSFKKARLFETEDRIFLQTVAYQCVQALDRARLYEAEQCARDVFLSVAAHELRTPLTALTGQAQLLRRRIIRDTGASQRDQRSIEVIVTQAERLSHMISALLDVTRIEQGQLSIERKPLDLVALVRQVAEELQPMFTRHTITYDMPETSIIIDGDVLRLEQVFHNLISNAVKYSPDGGTICVLVECNGENARVAISDQGIGIPVLALPHLFQRFYRAANADFRAISGMGVGLYVVKEIVALHEGSVVVASEEGVGSTFSVHLPLDSAYLRVLDSAASTVE